MPCEATQMDLEIITLNEVSQKEKNRFTDIEKRNVITKEGDGGGKDGEFEISRCKLLYVKWINNKVQPYSTGN